MNSKEESSSDVVCIKVPLSGTMMIDQAALLEMWSWLGKALAMLGYRTDGIKMPLVKALILDEREFTEFANNCECDELGRDEHRKRCEEEHGRFIPLEEAGGFVVTTCDPDGYVIAIERFSEETMRRNADKKIRQLPEEIVDHLSEEDLKILSESQFRLHRDYYWNLAFPLDYICKHELLHVWEHELGIEKPGALMEQIEQSQEAKQFIEMHPHTVSSRTDALIRATNMMSESPNVLCQEGKRNDR